jgi:hypothetical protein
VIEAYQFDNRITNPPPHWLRKAVDVGDVTVFVHRGKAEQMTIRTLEGDMTAMPGDWIIQGVKGEIYPCKPDIFDATYDPAASPAQEVDETERMRKAAQALLDGLTSTYTARNGREVGIQGDDGEKCYIVHSDLVFDLRAALSAPDEGKGHE